MTFICYGAAALIGFAIAFSIPWERMGKWGCVWFVALLLILSGLVMS